MQLSPEAQKIYDNQLKELKIQVDSEILYMVPMCSYTRTTFIELAVNENAAEEKINELQNKMLYVFDKGVRLGLLKHGVMSKVAVHKIVSDDLSEKYAVYLFAYSPYSLQTLNESFGLDAFTERFFVQEGEIGPTKAWDELVCA